MKEYTINVEGFSDYQRTLVQKAFFKLGMSWFSGDTEVDIRLPANLYTNSCDLGETGEHLMWSKDTRTETTHTYEQLLTEAGMTHKLKYKVDLDEEVDLKVSYKHLAEIYTALWKFRGKNIPFLRTHKMLYKAGAKVETNGLRIFMNNKTPSELIDYNSYQDELLEALFGNDIPEETETQKKVRELREQAELMLEKAKELEDATD